MYSNIIITKKEKGIPMLLGIKLCPSSQGIRVLKEELLMLREHFQRDIFYFCVFDITTKIQFHGR